MVVLLLTLALLKYFPAHCITSRATVHCLECYIPQLCLLLGLITLCHICSATVLNLVLLNYSCLCWLSL